MSAIPKTDLKRNVPRRVRVKVGAARKWPITGPIRFLLQQVSQLNKLD
jgi:hypothetical protein